MAMREESQPLYLVTHRGELAVNDNEPVASRRTADREAGPLLETLVEATHHQAETIARIVNVLSIAPAPAGRFVGDDGQAVTIAPDGSWRREA